MTKQLEHGRGLLSSLIIPARQSRYLELLEKPKRRKDTTARLSQFKYVDLRYAIHTPPRRQSSPDIRKELKAVGATDNGRGAAEEADFDAKENKLSPALQRIVGRGIGSFLSRRPGRTAHFEDEDHRLILERRMER